jgi:hypothetical protein
MLNILAGAALLSLGVVVFGYAVALDSGWHGFIPAALLVAAALGFFRAAEKAGALDRMGRGTLALLSLTLGAGTALCVRIIHVTHWPENAGGGPGWLDMLAWLVFSAVAWREFGKKRRQHQAAATTVFTPLPGPQFVVITNEPKKKGGLFGWIILAGMIAWFVWLHGGFS